MIKSIIQNDIQLFCDLGGLFWGEVNLDLGEDRLFPFALAVIFGYKTMVQLILKNKHSNKGQTDAQGWNVLHYCSRYDRLEILDMLFRKLESNQKKESDKLDQGELRVSDFIIEYA